MAFDTVRRIAADILGVGENRIRFASDKLGEIKNAMMRADVRDLISKKVITVAPKKGRRKKRHRKKHGEGSRKGSKSGKERKKEWMARIRSQRKLLARLVEDKIIRREHKKTVYLKIKGNSFRSKRALIAYLKDNGLVAKDFEFKKEKGGKG